MDTGEGTRRTPRKDRRPLGAYGLRFGGVEGASSFLVPAGADWPFYELVGRAGEPAPAAPRVESAFAEFLTPTGVQVRIDRNRGRAVFTLPQRPGPEQLVHPLSAHLAALAGWWLGRESLHAGAVILADGVWALVGDRETGKSSTLAWLAREGHTIVCDDMLILDGLQPFAGPRSLDLRREAAEALAVGERIGASRGRERWRVALGAIGELPPLQGLVRLTWGDSVEARTLDVSERLELIASSRGVNLPAPDPAAWLTLAALPTWELRRPRGLECLPAVAERLRGLPSARRGLGVQR